MNIAYRDAESDSIVRLDTSQRVDICLDTRSFRRSQTREGGSRNSPFSLTQVISQSRLGYHLRVTKECGMKKRLEIWWVPQGEYSKAILTYSEQLYHGKTPRGVSWLETLKDPSEMEDAGECKAFLALLFPDEGVKIYSTQRALPNHLQLSWCHLITLPITPLFQSLQRTQQDLEGMQVGQKSDEEERENDAELHGDTSSDMGSTQEDEGVDEEEVKSLKVNALESPDRTITSTPTEPLGESWGDVSWYGRDGGLFISKGSQVILMPSEDVLSLVTERIGMSHPPSEVLDEVWNLLHCSLPRYHPLALEQHYLLDGLSQPKIILKLLYGCIDDFAQTPDTTQQYMAHGK
ncbi:hypothetical protein BJ684DRAFT_21918, partial [Piptocephalis cylindrospora]